MILDQFVLGGTNGEYPIIDFNLELNYDQTSKLKVKLPAAFLNEIKNETYFVFYYLDNLLFEGIPYFVSRDGNEMELYIYDKNTSLWTSGGFAISGNTGIISYENTSVYDIVKDITNGSQFSVTTTSVPGKKVSHSGNFATKIDFLYNIAKQCMDEYGNTCTVWVDNKNVIHIGSKNSDITVDLTNETTGSGKEEINLIKFGGSIVQGGEDVSGNKIIETSNDTSIYADYHIANRTLASYNIIHNPAINKSLANIALDSKNGSVRIGFAKPSTAPLKYVNGTANSSGVRNGNAFTASVMLTDKSAIYDYEECDFVFKVKLDNVTSTDANFDGWYPYYPCDVYEGWGLPYTFIHNATVGLINTEGKVMASVTIERYANDIQFYKAGQYSTIVRSLASNGVINFYVNMEQYNASESIGMEITTPYNIIYNHYKEYSFYIWFRRRYGQTGNEWQVKVIRDNGSIWAQVVKDGRTDGVLFDQTIPYDNSGASSAGLNVGGIPFIKSELKTNVDTYLVDTAWKISQISTANYKVPLFVGTPQKVLQHKPYLFYADTNIKYKSQAKSLAQNLFNDYSKTLTADVDINPMAFFYPENAKLDVGCIAKFDSPAPIVGEYRIKSIVATQDRVTVSLQNRSVNASDIIDRMQKQIKDIGAQ